MHRSCQAAVFEQVGQPLFLRDVTIPALAPGELLVRVTCCTICGSDLHTYAGRRGGPTPCILGHEILGVVESMADAAYDVDDLPIGIGDRITWSVVVSCGTCPRCQSGIPQKCDSLFKYGHELANVPNGGLAQRCLLADRTAMVKLPIEIPDEVFCPANCATATVAAAVRTSGSLAGKRVLIFGAGMLGLTAAAFASAQRAAEICVCDVDESRLRRAEEFGATRLAPTDPPMSEFDVVFEISGSSDAVQASIASAAVGGTIVLVGSVFPTSPVPIDPEQVVRRLLSIHGVHNYRPDDLLTAVKFLTEHHRKFPFAELVERTFALEQAADALNYAEANRPIRVAVRP